MDNGPISVSAPGVSLIGAAAKDITFSTRYPFAKLDSTNPVSFQIITIFFNTDPPNPTPGNDLVTLIYSFPHGYTYTPSTWFLISLDNFTTVTGSDLAYLIGSPSGTNLASATFYAEVDETNVYFYVDKFIANAGSPSPPDIIGFFVSVRAYVFVEDLLGNSVPSQA